MFFFDEIISSQKISIVVVNIDFESNVSLWIVNFHRYGCGGFITTTLIRNGDGQKANWLPDTVRIERCRWQFCHLPSLRNHTLVSSDCWVWATPCLNSNEWEKQKIKFHSKCNHSGCLTCQHIVSNGYRRYRLKANKQTKNTGN